MFGLVELWGFPHTPLQVSLAAAVVLSLFIVAVVHAWAAATYLGERSGSLRRVGNEACYVFWSQLELMWWLSVAALARLWSMITDPMGHVEDDVPPSPTGAVVVRGYATRTAPSPGWAPAPRTATTSDESVPTADAAPGAVRRPI
ncbi:hypothetical protein E9529_21200 [Blastococcus sp. KM273128]|nr:hypothetical protein [Blastococcus sp. KM273128]